MGEKDICPLSQSEQKVATKAACLPTGCHDSCSGDMGALPPQAA